MSQENRPFVFSFVSVNGTREVLGTRDVVRDELDEKLALVEEWLAEKPKSRCATLYGPGMRRRVVTMDTRRWLEQMEILRPAPVREFPKGADPRITAAEQVDGYSLYAQGGRVSVEAIREALVAARTVADMKAALRDNGLKVSGVKRALAHRLAENGIAPY
jgi:hypothetical protein